MTSRLILPIFTPPPAAPWQEASLARYVGSLIALLERRFAESKALDVALADRIESLLWPDPEYSQCRDQEGK